MSSTRDAWSDLGLDRDVVVVQRAADWHGFVPLGSFHGSHERGRDGFDPNLEIGGLGFAVANPTPERSLLLWNLLSRLNAPFEGVVEHSTRQGFDNPTPDTVVSEVGKVLASHEWLPAADDRWCKPGELSLDDLDEAFPRDEGLAIRLKMLPTVGREVAEYLDIEPGELTLLRRNPEFLHSILKAMREAESGAAGDGDKIAEDAAASDVDVAEAVHDAFNRDGASGREEFYGDGVATDPDRRRERGEAALHDAQGNEPPAKERWQVRDRKTWESRSRKLASTSDRPTAGDARSAIKCFLDATVPPTSRHGTSYRFPRHGGRTCPVTRCACARHASPSCSTVQSACPT